MCERVRRLSLLLATANCEERCQVCRRIARSLVIPHKELVRSSRCCVLACYFLHSLTEIIKLSTHLVSNCKKR